MKKESDLDLESFKTFVKQLSIPELTKLQYDLRQYPEDAKFLEITFDEIKNREK